jgi:cell division protein FtsA
VNRLWGLNPRASSALVGIDAGNVDVRAAVAAMDGTADDPDREAALRVLGIGVSPAQGLRRGMVVDAERLGLAIRTAVSQAERAAGHHILGAYFSVPLSQFDPGAEGDHPSRMFLSSSLAIQEITQHATERTAIWQRVAGAADLQMVGIVPSVLAASAAVIMPEEHEHGVIVVECGAEHTSIACFVNGEISALGTIPVGGDHITRDLVSVLGINPLDAERLKFDVGNARTTRRGLEILVPAPDGGRMAVPVALVAAVTTARVEQILKNVSEMVRAVPAVAAPRTARTALVGGLGQVVLCGGGAALSGLAPMARTALGMPVRIAGAWGFSGPRAVQSPVYAAVLGLLRWRAMVRPARARASDLARGVVLSGRAIGTIEEKTGAQPVRTGQTRWQTWLREFLP